MWESRLYGSERGGRATEAPVAEGASHLLEDDLWRLRAQHCHVVEARRSDDQEVYAALFDLNWPRSDTLPQWLINPPMPPSLRGDS